MRHIPSTAGRRACNPCGRGDSPVAPGEDHGYAGAMSAPENPDDKAQTNAPTPAPPANAGRHAMVFTIAGVFGLVILVLLYAVIVRTSIFDNGFHIAFAMFVGVLGTAGLGFALMSMVFYSARSGADEAATHNTDEHWRESD
ncbi:MAG: hypothetical protein KDA46_03595 [Parvularculaceae bacterium]|nr:hypothetical protein [Parvularculaceae bacterium]